MTGRKPRLTVADRVEIKRRYLIGLIHSSKSIARDFNISRSYVSMIARGKTRRDLKCQLLRSTSQIQKSPSESGPETMKLSSTSIHPAGAEKSEKSSESM